MNHRVIIQNPLTGISLLKIIHISYRSLGASRGVDGAGVTLDRSATLSRTREGDGLQEVGLLGVLLHVGLALNVIPVNLGAAAALTSIGQFQVNNLEQVVDRLHRGVGSNLQTFANLGDEGLNLLFVAYNFDY